MDSRLRRIGMANSENPQEPKGSASLPDHSSQNSSFTCQKERGPAEVPEGISRSPWASSLSPETRFKRPRGDICRRGGRGRHAQQLWERQTSHLEPHGDKGRGPDKTGVFIIREVGVGDRQCCLSSEPQASH